MDARTVDWSAWRGLEPGAEEAGGLRERKKRQMRQQLSDTATEMFMERGFDAVRVSEIAAACGVSEKTVFNYFPTKESLLLDRWDATMSALRDGLGDPAYRPVEAALRILDDELRAHSPPGSAARTIRPPPPPPSSASAFWPGPPRRRAPTSAT